MLVVWVHTGEYVCPNQNTLLTSLCGYYPLHVWGWCAFVCVILPVLRYCKLFTYWCGKQQ